LLRIRSYPCLSVLSVVLFCAVAAKAQDEQPTTTLQLSSKLVLVPAQVQTKSGEMIYGLTPEQFKLEDDGVQQQIKLDEDTDALGLSLVVVVECSRKSYQQFDNMRGLPALVDELTGGPNDEVAMISYGTEIEQLTGFTKSEKKIAQAYTDLQPCDDEKDAMTLDAVEAADKLFAKAPATNRHAILLIGETRDHGSKVRTAQVVADLNRTNVVVDAVSFNPGKDDLLGMLHGDAPNPKEFLMLVVNAVRKNVPHSLADASGGEYTNFNSQRKFEKGMGRLQNKIHNYYLLSFQEPATAEPGLHRLKLTVPDHSDAKLRYRLMYYAGDASVPDVPEDKADEPETPAKPTPPPPR
jgi:VWFA-related protein